MKAKTLELSNALIEIYNQLYLNEINIRHI